MSEENKTSGQNDQIGDEIEKKDSVAYATYQKLLGEKKKRDQELADAKAKLDSIEQAQMEAQGKFKEQNEMLKKKLAETEGKLKGVFQDFGTKTLKSGFEAEAKAAGCVDADALYKLVDLSSVDIGEDFTFNKDQIKTVISEAQKSRDYLFKKEVSKVNDATPTTTNLKQDGIKGKSIDELASMLSKIE